MSDFFDQDTGYEENNNVPMEDTPTGANILVNGSYQSLEVGSEFIPAVQAFARQAGFGKFKCFLNGVEVKPKTTPGLADRLVEADDRVEIRPFDEAG